MILPKRLCLCAELRNSKSSKTEALKIADTLIGLFIFNRGFQNTRLNEKLYK
jgi:hypothetical protein